MRNKTGKAYGLFSKVETNNGTDTILIEIVSLCQRNNLRNEVLREGKILMAISKIGNGQSRNGERGTGNGERESGTGNL